MYFPEFRSKHQTTHKNCAPKTEVIIFFVDLSIIATHSWFLCIKILRFIPQWYNFWPNLNRSNRSCTQTLKWDAICKTTRRESTKLKSKLGSAKWEIFAIQTNYLVYIRAVYHWDFVRISLSWRIKQVTSVDILETLYLFTWTSVYVLKYSLRDDISPVDAYIYMDRSRVDISTHHSYMDKAWLFAIQAFNTLRTPVSSITHWADRTLIIVWLTSQHYNVVHYCMYQNLHQLGLCNSTSNYETYDITSFEGTYPQQQRIW